MEANLPIYGLAASLACPGKKHCNCGCKKRKPMRRTVVTAQIIDTTTGKPFDANTVHIKNLDNKDATTTIEDGFFTIGASPNDLLEITHIGYETIAVKAADLKSKVPLTETSEVLDEVVIKPKKKRNNLLLVLGLAAVVGIAYATSDKKKSTSGVPNK